MRVKLQADKRVLTASSDVRLVPGPIVPVVIAQAEPPPKKRAVPLWLWGGGGLVILAVLGLLLTRRRNVVPVPQPSVPAPLPTPTPDTRPAASVVESIESARPTLRSGIRIQLTAVSGAQRGRDWMTEVGTETVIGRSASCAVVIDDDSEISAKNSVLSADGGLLFVEDLGSTNGTSINGSPIKGRRRVGNGDLILVGRTELRLTLPMKL